MEGGMGGGWRKRRGEAEKEIEGGGEGERRGRDERRKRR